MGDIIVGRSSMGPGQPSGSAADIIQKIKVHISNKDIPKAITEAQRHIGSFPKDPSGFIALAMAYKKAQRFKDALMILDQAVEVGPSVVTAWSLRGLLRALLGNFDGALTDANKALAIKPTDRIALGLKAQMEERIKVGRTSSPVRPEPLASTPKEPIGAVPVTCVEPPKPPTPRPALQVLSDPRPENLQETRFLAPELSQAIVNELEADKESMLVLVPKLQALKTVLATMQALTEMYEMDGIVICADSPAKFLKKAFSKYSKHVELVHYLELMSGEEPTGLPPGADSCCQTFDLEGLIKVIDEGLHHKAHSHGGEDHFVLWDDASALKFYHEPKAMQRFFAALTEHLASMDVVHVVILPTESANLLQRWPVSAFQTTIYVKPSWMSPFK